MPRGFKAVLKENWGLTTSKLDLIKRVVRQKSRFGVFGKNLPLIHRTVGDRNQPLMTLSLIKWMNRRTDGAKSPTGSFSFSPDSGSAAGDGAGSWRVETGAQKQIPAREQKDSQISGQRDTKRKKRRVLVLVPGVWSFLSCQFCSSYELLAFYFLFLSEWTCLKQKMLV